MRGVVHEEYLFHLTRFLSSQAARPAPQQWSDQYACVVFHALLPRRNSKFTPATGRALIHVVGHISLRSEQCPSTLKRGAYVRSRFGLVTLALFMFVIFSARKSTSTRTFADRSFRDGYTAYTPSSTPLYSGRTSTRSPHSRSAAIMKLGCRMIPRPASAAARQVSPLLERMMGFVVT